MGPWGLYERPTFSWMVKTNPVVTMNELALEPIVTSGEASRWPTTTYAMNAAMMPVMRASATFKYMILVRARSSAWASARFPVGAPVGEGLVMSGGLPAVARRVGPKTVGSEVGRAVCPSAGIWCSDTMVRVLSY